MSDLHELRRKLDAVDRRVVENLFERLQTVAEIAQVKAEGLSFLRDHDREAELLARIQGWARELGMDGFRVQEIFREVIAMSLKAQEEQLLRRDRQERSAKTARLVTFQGINGSYSELAAKKYFGVNAATTEFIGMTTFAETLAAAEQGDAGYAVLPIENTTAGSINQTYDLLRQTQLAIVGEEIYHVRHRLLATDVVEPASLLRVMSHPQALVQCSVYLGGLTGVELVASEDTAAAARAVREAGDPSVAAIASQEAAELYGLEVIADAVADQDENWTRFVIISALELDVDPRIPSKTSLVLTTSHRHGALAQCLNVISEHGLNLSKLESRPVPRRPWEYLFYLDFEGSLASEPATLAVAALQRLCPYLKVLGTYPARTTADGAVDRLR